MLCHQCAAVLHNLPEELPPDHLFKLPEPVKTTSFGDLLSGAAAGCYICLDIAGQLQDENGLERLKESDKDAPIFTWRVSKSSLRDEPVIYIFTDVFDAGETKGAGWHYHLVATSQPHKDFGFTFEAQSSNQIRATHRNYPIISPTTQSPKVGALARQWYEQCRLDHPICQALQSTIHRRYPPRLLDLTSDTPKIVCGHNVPSGQAYAALSHCWGSAKFLTLTQDRLHEFQANGIPLTEIPPNFRDAMEACRWLSIRYLWIDSLCIVQAGPGSREDWELHVRVMVDIYAGCDVCISTAATASAVEPSLKYRDVRAIAPVSVLYGGVPHILIESGHVTRGFRTAPIASRAWTFQERLLSRRILTLGQKQLFWECEHPHSKNVCETFPSGISAPCPTRGPFSLPQIPSAADMQYHTWIIWHELIETYSECKLTYVEDKLAAFAGIAAHMQAALEGPPYLAGFFEPELPRALLWYPRGNSKPAETLSHTSRAYCAPSWSWAATDAPLRSGKVIPDEADTEESSSASTLAFIVSYRIQLKDPLNQFGPLLYAEITLRAPLIALTWADTGIYLKNQSNDPNDMPHIVYNMPEIGFIQISKSFFFDRTSDHEGAQDGVYILPISRDVYGIEGLIVRAANMYELLSRRGVIVHDMRFTRIGVARFVQEEPNHPIELLEKKDVTLI